MYNNEDDSVEGNSGNLPSYEDDFLFNTTGKDHDEEVKGKEKKRAGDNNNNNNNKNYDNNYDYKYDDIYDIITNPIKESEMKNEMKISDININNDNTSTLVVNYRKKKRTNLNDSSYYSLKLPKFIDVCLDIKKKNRNINDAKVNEDDINKNNNIYLSGKEENNSFNKYFFDEDDHITLLNKKKNGSIVQWIFDNHLYEQMKCQKKEKEKEKEKNITDIINMNNNIDTYEKMEEPKKDSLHISSTKQKLNNNNNDNNHNNNYYYVDDEDSNDEDVFHVKDLLDKYDIEYLSDSDYMTTSTNESDDEKNILLKNLEHLETNSFIVEYGNGQHFLFINDKTYMLEQDKETNYLIECTDENIMPIHAKLKNKFYIKSLTKEDKVHPSDLKLQKSHVFYSLNNHKI
ncbi:hypothetical protein PRSY57_1330200 [Plasmodium reichenowi]|uniref:Uncharacterized protein n=1 Tax=Plasmodium reichenowi TaxID=5854 RepID=A0A151L708_PLARE|nr:hypothetical protein PRSY57_1330200 [Plasmodium reichenowi]KYN94755.1 hypothetical protein PRSY57_1330200 [Plasmodium reichenowi]